MYWFFAAVLTLVKVQGDQLDFLRITIPGEPGVDYPIHNNPTNSLFSCEERVVGAYYVDPSLDCQAYHVCIPRTRVLTRRSFICPNGTIFNQAKLVCDWWFDSSCKSDERQYSQSEQTFSVRTSKNIKDEKSNKKGKQRSVNNDKAGSKKENKIKSEFLAENRLNEKSLIHTKSHSSLLSSKQSHIKENTSKNTTTFKKDSINTKTQNLQKKKLTSTDISEKVIHKTKGSINVSTRLSSQQIIKQKNIIPSRSYLPPFPPRLQTPIAKTKFTDASPALNEVKVDTEEGTARKPENTSFKLIGPKKFDNDNEYGNQDFVFPKENPLGTVPEPPTKLKVVSTTVGTSTKPSQSIKETVRKYVIEIKNVTKQTNHKKYRQNQEEEQFVEYDITLPSQDDYNTFEYDFIFNTESEEQENLLSTHDITLLSDFNEILLDEENFVL